jgi:transposase-like protein
MIRPINKGITSKGSQRYFCPACKQTFTDTFDTIYYRRQLQADEVHTILQSHCEGSSLRGVARISGRAYGTVVNLVRDASQKAQMIHNALVKQVKTIAITADELWSFIQKNRNTVCLENLRWVTAGLA